MDSANWSVPHSLHDHRGKRPQMSPPRRGPSAENTGAVEKGVRADVLGGNEQAAHLQRMLWSCLTSAGLE